MFFSLKIVTNTSLAKMHIRNIFLLVLVILMHNYMIRYCMVLFAGIAGEALVYGEAKGGENDENMFCSIFVLLQPPLSIAQMSNQAKWSVLQSFNLLILNGTGTLIKLLSQLCKIMRFEEAMSLFRCHSHSKLSKNKKSMLHCSVEDFSPFEVVSITNQHRLLLTVLRI
ncbi:hypothetical protein SLA2020_192320 [Shorea laevis]